MPGIFFTAVGASVASGVAGGVASGTAAGIGGGGAGGGAAGAAGGGALFALIAQAKYYYNCYNNLFDHDNDLESSEIYIT